MSKYDNLPFHPMMEKVVDILRQRTQNENPVFFRLMVSYYFSKIASMMRTYVQIGEDQKIPVNMYAINLAPSGSGKGHSMAIIEQNLIAAFRKKFLEETFPAIAEVNLNRLANTRALRNDTKPEDELKVALGEFEELGYLLFSFDSATGPAIKQMRTKLLMATAGSMNFEMDEIGSNFTGNTEALNTFLELFDLGRIKQKLIKNTRENIRSEDLYGDTPTNMLLFGTPIKLLDGGKTEDDFISFCDIGYARRCFFGFARYRRAKQNQTAQDMYDLYHDRSAIKYLDQVSDKLQMLAERSHFNHTLQMRKPVLMALYDYRIWCQNEADKLSEYDEVRKNEMAHRYFKAAKLAAVYAFVDGAPYIEMDHLNYALAMAQQSGEAIDRILNRESSHVKLANYICGIGRELTQSELMEKLPFYKGSEQARRDMLNLAMAHGYKQGMSIRSELIDGIQFLSGSRMEEVDLEKVSFSYSKKLTEGYIYQEASFWELDKLTQTGGYHWVNHQLKDGYRNEESCIPGANIIVLDVENSIDIDTAKYLLKDYAWHIHTTKRHDKDNHRFRIIMPLSHRVDMDAKDFKEFMKNIFDWLPFSVDDGTGQRSRKWLTHKGNFWYNKGELLDTMQFVPKTKKADERRQILASQTNMNALQRWALNQAGEGNRNDTLARHAFTMVELGWNLDQIRHEVMDLNSKFPDPLSDNEVLSTVIVSANKRIQTKNGGK